MTIDPGESAYQAKEAAAQLAKTVAAGGQQVTGSAATFFSNAITTCGDGSCYIDMGQIAGDALRTGLWGGGPGGGDLYNLATVQPIIASLITQLQASGVSSVSLSFAQVSDIPNLASGQWTNTGNTDSILDMFQNGNGVTTPPPVVNTSTGQTVAPNLLQYFNSQMNNAGIKVDLSIGGQDANSGSWNIGSNPAATATQLSNFMSANNFASCDFDIENPSALISANGQGNVATFFSTLHTNLQSAGKTSSITLDCNVPATPPGWDNSVLNFLFQNPSGGCVFPTYFDSVNIMNYGGPNNPQGGSTNAYLDANNPVDGLQQWLAVVGNVPSRLHVGFCVGTDYTNAATYTGITGQTNWASVIPGLTSMSPGAAAAAVYQALLAQVQTNTGINMSTMGAPFWWASDPMNPPPAGTPPAFTADTMMSDFYTALGGSTAVNTATVDPSHHKKHMFGM